ncbi:MAG: hypothetical protein O6952_01920 [Planctomycetota bacterium]|nr:hypothetical protein [Planctomycetota bacterium]
MTASQAGGPPGWIAFVLRVTLLTALVFVAAAYPFYLWEGKRGLLLLGIGACLEVVLIWISYGMFLLSLRRSQGAQFYAILLGRMARFGSTIAALLILWYGTDLPSTASVVSLMMFYLTLIFYEAKVCWSPTGR